MKHIKVTLIDYKGELSRGFVDGSRIVAAVPIDDNVTRLYFDCSFNDFEGPRDDFFEAGIVEVKTYIDVYDSPMDVLSAIDECEEINYSRRR